MATETYNQAIENLHTDGVMLLDGGVSTELQRRGVPMDEETWSGQASLDHWQVLVDTHRAYIDAGADIITTNTYASSRLMLEPAGLADKVDDINQRSIEAALTAREKSGARNVLIAGSLSHAIPLQIRSEAEPVEDSLGKTQLLAAFREMISIFSNGEVDLILLEMMSKPNRMAAVFEALADTELPVWCGLSTKRDDSGSLVAAHDVGIPFKENVAKAASQKFDAWGVMHTSAELIDESLGVLMDSSDRLLMAYPDSGYIEMPNWNFVDIMTPSRLVQFTETWIASGAQIVGGCCGLGPEHISAIAHLKR